MLSVTVCVCVCVRGGQVYNLPLVNPDKKKKKKKYTNSGTLNFVSVT